MKVKQLVKNILTHYKEKDETMSAEGAKAKYYVRREMNASGEDFDGVSSENRIVLKSSLPYVDIFVIMNLFEAIYNNNYYLFNKNLYSGTINDDDKENLMFKYEDYCVWVNFFTEDSIYSNGDDIENCVVDETNENFDIEISNLFVFFKKPNPLSYFSKMEYAEQKVYCIDDIIELI